MGNLYSEIKRAIDNNNHYRMHQGIYRKVPSKFHTSKHLINEHESV